jgi:amino acid transporter
MGSRAVANVQTVVVVVVIGILSVFAIVTLVNMSPHLLAPSGYPPLKDIVSAVALTFFAFLGFGVVTFTAGEMDNPKRQLPRAVYLALGIATLIYVAVSLGVFGTLTVKEVIESGGTAIAVAAQPVLGRAGYWLMTVTALFATAGATNAGLYPITGLSQQMVASGQFPPAMARSVVRRQATLGLLLTTGVSAALTLGFDLSAIASLGSAIALLVFAFISIGHLRVHRETGASVVMLLLAIGTALAVFVTFTATTLVSEPATVVAIVVTVAGSIVIDALWKRARDRRAASPSAVSPPPAPAGLPGA